MDGEEFDIKLLCFLIVKQAKQMKNFRTDKSKQKITSLYTDIQADINTYVNIWF